MRIVEVTEVTAELVAAFERLTPQLSSSNPAPSAEALAEIIEASACHLLVAVEESGEIVGTLTLVVFPIPTGTRAWIEDVIADEAHSGKGIGEALSRHALDMAREHGARTVGLTSRPSREAANHIYRKIGFQPRETNVYRYSFES